MLTSTKMRGATLGFPLLGILLLVGSPSPCDALCNMVNGTIVQCRDLEDAKYIDTYDLEILKTSVSEGRLYPGIFRNLSSLRHLDLSHGKLEHIDPGTFRSLPELRSLDLSHNILVSIEENAFDGLKKLRSLNIRKNAITEIPLAVLHLKNLKILDLALNPLHCSCATMKTRDILVDRGVHMSKRVLCSSPANLKGKSLLEPDAAVICMFDEQDKDMQMDQPAVEGSGETASGDPFDDITPDKLDEEEHDIIDEAPVTSASEVETPAPTKSSDEEVPIAPAEQPTSSVPTVTEELRDELFFSEENDKRASTAPVTSSTKSAEEVEPTKETDKESLLRQPIVPDHSVEGSGEEDLQEGSGAEGSGTAVPPISWDLPDETNSEATSSEPAGSSDSGWLGIIWDAFAGTSQPPEDEKKKDLNLEDEEFINASSEPTPASSPKPPVDENVESPIVLSDSGTLTQRKLDDNVKNDGVTVNVGQALDDSKSGKVRAEDEHRSEVEAEATDASLARQPKQGMGSYIVLAALLAVLAALLGFAAYKGDYCKKKRKRNDVEGGTELKDMTKSLLEPGNGTQAKIASNGNMENVPLVCTSPPDDSRVQQTHREPDASSDGSKMRYSAAPDIVDPVKPPRKSFNSHEEPDRNLTNGRSHQDLVNSSPSVPENTDPVCLRNKSPVETAATHGNNHHDSDSSLGAGSRDSPSARTSPPFSTSTNGSLGTLQGLTRPPLSPGAQRVKITLQENPDSVPRTPILITRTKAGENLVKTP